MLNIRGGKKIMPAANSDKHSFRSQQREDAVESFAHLFVLLSSPLSHNAKLNINFDL